MQNIKKALVGIALLIVIIVTVVFLANAYNTGKLGNKAEKIADTFAEDILGTWTGKYSISGITFKEDNKTALTMLGVVLDGTYSDSYDLETQKHTLTLKYNTVLGISVERQYEAKLDGDKLLLKDTQLDSVELRYTRNTDSADSSEKTDVKTESYNPGVDVYQKEIIGKWISTKGSNSGYEFIDDSTVGIKLMGVSYNGKYSLSVDESTNQCLLKITYASVAGVNIDNSYYVSIADDVLSLTQKGANITTTFTKETN